MSTRLLSKSEKEYIRRGVECDLRADGRARLDFRPFNLELDVVPQAAGSARLRLGRTDILVSIKTDIGRPDLATPGLGAIACSADAASGAAAAASAGSGMAGGEGAEERQRNDRLAEIGSMMSSMLREGLDLEQLCILAGQHCWSVFVDVLVLDEDGNLLDAIALATRAALARTRLPGVTVETGSEAADAADSGGNQLVLSDDPAQSKLLSISGLPVAVTLLQLSPQGSIIVDASLPEEGCSEAALCLAVEPAAGRILFTRKLLGGSFDASRLVDMLQTGQRLAAALASALDSQLMLP